LVDEDDLNEPRRSVWLRWTAAGVIALFLLASALAAGAGASTLLSGSPLIPTLQPVH